MNKNVLLMVALAAAPAAAQHSGRPASSATSAARPHGTIDPQADAVLRRMSDYMGSLSTFRVVSNAIDEVVQPSGQKLQWLSESQLTMRRPNMIRTDRVGPLADVTFRYDGQSFNIFGNRTGYYASVPAPQRLDEAVDTLRNRYGIDVPAADLILEHPYNALMEDTTSGEYVGLEPIEGTNCHHLAFRGRDVDWQIWVADGARPLPMRYVITSKRMTGQPQFSVSLSHWEPGVQVADDTFRFQPPAGATRIQLMDSSWSATHRGGGERQGR